MPKPALPMKPTGWFQVAWSDEINVGDVHRMTYFDLDMVAWRAESGAVTVMVLPSCTKFFMDQIPFGVMTTWRGDEAPPPASSISLLMVERAACISVTLR